MSFVTIVEAVIAHMEHAKIKEKKDDYFLVRSIFSNSNSFVSQFTTRQSIFINVNENSPDLDSFPVSSNA